MIKYEIAENFTALSSKILAAESHFTPEYETIHKARNELKIITLGELKTVVKAFKIPNLLNRVIYSFFRDSKAKKSYQNARQLRAMGINTPEPVAYIEHYTAGFFDKSYYISLHEAYDFTIREALHHDVEDYQDILKAFTAFTHELHLKGVWHEDYSPGNILITRTPEGYRFSLVDVNRMQFRPISAEEGTKNFSKLWIEGDDVELIAGEYAQCSGRDATAIAQEIRHHQKKIQRLKERKKRLKTLF